MSAERKRYKEEFKYQTVKSIQEQTKTVAELALELDIPTATLYQWVKKYQQLPDEAGTTSERARELERLIQEKDQRIADMAEELAIIKKAAHIFSKPKN